MADEREQDLVNIIGDRLQNLDVQGSEETVDAIEELSEEEYSTLVDSIFNVYELLEGDVKAISQVFSEVNSAIEDMYPSSGEGEDDQQMREWNPDEGCVECGGETDSGETRCPKCIKAGGD